MKIMKKPRIGHRMMVDGHVKFVTRISGNNLSRIKYYMTDELGSGVGEWRQIQELRDMEFHDYLWHRSGFFGSDTRLRALAKVAIALMPIAAGMAFGSVVSIIGTAITIGLFWHWFRSEQKAFEDCCKNSEGTSES